MTFRTLPKCPHRRRALYRCPGLVSLDSHSRCIGALVAAQLWAPRVRVVAQGVDTLHLFTTRSIDPAWAERLRLARLEAEELGEHELEIGSLTLTMRDRGAGGARYLLESDLWVFKVSPTPKPGHPTVQLEVRALALWANGWRRASEMALDAAAELCGCGAAGVDALEAQVTRADLCVDFQGWAPRADELELFTTRATRRGAHAGASWEWLQGEDGRAATRRKRSAVLELAGRLKTSSSIVEQHQLMLELGDAAGEDSWAASTWRHGRTLTGFSFGKGRIAARLYDKRREIGVSGKHWMRTVWRRCAAFDGRSGELAAYLEDAEVWRLEFQLRREAVTSLEELVPPEPGSDWESLSLGSWAHFVGRLDSLWRYLSHQWLRHGRRQEDNRQATSAVWEQLQKAWSAEEPEPVNLHRPAVEAARVVVVPQLAGLLATAAAQVQVLAEVDEKPAETLPYWRVLLAAVRAAHDYTKQKDDTLEHKSHARARAMEKRGTALRGTPSACRARTAAAARLLSAKVPARWWESRRWKSPAYAANGAGVPLAGPTGLVTSVSMKAKEVGW